MWPLQGLHGSARLQVVCQQPNLGQVCSIRPAGGLHTHAMAGLSGPHVNSKQKPMAPDVDSLPYRRQSSRAMGSTEMAMSTCLHQVDTISARLVAAATRRRPGQATRRAQQTKQDRHEVSMSSPL
jgi:hypothetical protein